MLNAGSLVRMALAVVVTCASLSGCSHSTLGTPADEAKVADLASGSDGPPGSATCDLSSPWGIDSAAPRICGGPNDCAGNPCCAHVASILTWDCHTSAPPDEVHCGVSPTDCRPDFHLEGGEDYDTRLCGTGADCFDAFQHNGGTCCTMQANDGTKYRFCTVGFAPPNTVTDCN